MLQISCPAAFSAQNLLVNKDYLTVTIFFCETFPLSSPSGSVRVLLVSSLRDNDDKLGAATDKPSISSQKWTVMASQVSCKNP